MKIEQTGNELIIQEAPGCLWILGLLFVFIGGVFVYGSLGGFTNADEVPRYAIYLAFLMGAIAVAAGVWVIFHAPVTKVFINRQTETVAFVRRGLFGKRENIFSFEQIKQFCLIEEKDSEGDPIWSLGMELSNGETIKISSLESHSENFKRDFVFQTNEFMHKPMPSYKTSFELEDESRTKIS
ncbi:MAG TPA: hypothetical protein VK892_04000 [Pyrinomonadaceae bacterium]|nr:hypothetical protein [Pyrinomonadaceae bacterium]